MEVLWVGFAPCVQSKRDLKLAAHGSQFYIVAT